MKDTLLVLVLVALAGCSTAPTRPAPRAHVRFSTDSRLVAVLRQYDDYQCRAGESEVLRFKAGESREATLPAGQPFRATFTGASKASGNTYEGCGAAFSFIFQKGQDYDVDFNVERCTLQIIWLERKPDGHIARIPQVVGSMDAPECRKAMTRPRGG